MLTHLPKLIAALSFALTAMACAASETPAARRVAFIFDDGPVVAQTEAFIALLKREQVRVTFAYVGEKVTAHPALARAAAAAGHEIVNHSFTHPHLKDLDDAAVTREVRDTTAAIAEATGRPPRWFWAPFLEWDERLARLARATGLEHFPYKEVNFVSTEDWNRDTDAATIRRRATTGLRDRTVVLCHEWREETLAELPAIIAELRRQGFQFVTFSELLARSG